VGVGLDDRATGFEVRSIERKEGWKEERKKDFVTLLQVKSRIDICTLNRLVRGIKM
jgi:hypothetical protein